MLISLDGRIMRGVGGFYYVETEQGIYASKARGLFRKRGKTPLPGDLVSITVTHEGDKEAYIEEIKPRVSLFVRPPCANIDRMFIVAAATTPTPVPLLIDKMTAICEKKGIESVIVINKCDLIDSTALVEDYRKTGYTVVPVSAETGEGVDEIERLIDGHICAFAGQSGVGKSSLLNRLFSKVQMEVGGLSARLERGRHTTRHVELFHLGGGIIADTPGYGDLSVERFEPVYKEELEHCFKEFESYIGECRFSGCVHDREPGCAVKDAVENGVIAQSRYNSYITMLNEVRDIKEWEK